MQITERMAALMADVDAVAKNRTNQQQGFHFRGIDDVYNAIHPLMAKHGVFTTPEVLAERTEERKTAKGNTLIYRVLTVRYTFWAPDGSNITTTVIGEGMDSGDKAAAKAMAIAHKYALLQTLCVPTEDMPDPDAESPPPSQAAKPKPSEELKQLAQRMKDALKELVADDAIKASYRDAGALAYKAGDEVALRRVLEQIANQNRGDVF